MFPGFPFHSHHMLHPYHPISPDVPSDFRAFYPYTPNEVKHRKRTTSAQLRTLENVFKRDTKPNAALRNQLAEQLKMTPRGVQVSSTLSLIPSTRSQALAAHWKVWFQNRRAKEKTKANKAKTVADSTKQEQTTSSGTATSGSQSPSTPSPKLDDTDPRLVLDQSDTQGEQPQEIVISATPPVITPPQLRVLTNPDTSEWDQRQSDDDALNVAHRRIDALSASELYATRRGSLPAHALLHHPISHNPPDPLAALQRRGSVDANLLRITNNYGTLPRVRTDASVGARGRRMLTSRSPPVSRPSQCFPQGRSSLCPPYVPPMEEQSPPQAPLPAYNGSSRASLPISNSLYAVPSRRLSPPGPGPLPAPNFQFGAAGMSSSPGESERNSPDSLTYKDEERDDDNTSVGSYVPHSRFGSFQSIATSESGSIYSDFTNLTSGMPSPAIASGRRHSCTPAFVGLMSTLGVNDMHSNAVPDSIIESPYPLDVSGNEYTDTCPPANSMFNYGQAAPAASAGDSACAQELLYSFSGSSELAHALQSQPQQAETSDLDDHMMCNPRASQPSSADGGRAQADGSFYVSESEGALDDAPSTIIPDFATALTSPESPFNLPFTQNYVPTKNTSDGLQPPMNYTQCATNIYPNYADSPFSPSTFPSNSPQIVEQCAAYS
ncbi:hypothetical protein F5887DRAFT_964296, partial [Amanita rubescens]